MYETRFPISQLEAGFDRAAVASVRQYFVEQATIAGIHLCPAAPKLSFNAFILCRGMWMAVLLVAAALAAVALILWRRPTQPDFVLRMLAGPRRRRKRRKG